MTECIRKVLRLGALYKAILFLSDLVVMLEDLSLPMAAAISPMLVVPILETKAIHQEVGVDKAARKLLLGLCQRPRLV
jgi:hypothetical protein